MGKYCALFFFLVCTLFGEANTVGAAGQPDKAKDAPVHPEKPKSFKLMPHKAVYNVKVHPTQKPNDPTVKNVTGHSTIEIVKTKDGWSHNHYLQVQVHYYDGTTTIIERNIASWESPNDVSFYIENSRDGGTESVLRGGSKLVDQKWQVFFEEPPGMDGFITDESLIFPVKYLENLLEAIEKGRTILSDQIVFDATYEMQRPVRINAVIAPVKDKKITVNDNSLIPSNKIWHIQMALYDIESSNTNPDYEVKNIHIFSTGVINSMEVSWGEGITVVLNLSELTVYQ